MFLWRSVPIVEISSSTACVETLRESSRKTLAAMRRWLERCMPCITLPKPPAPIGFPASK